MPDSNNALHAGNAPSESLTVDQAFLIALTLESALWGIFAVFYCLCSTSLLLDDESGKPKKLRDVHLLMVAAVNVMFVAGTFDVAITVYQCVFAFTRYKGEGGAEVVLNDIANWANLLMVINGSLQTFVADSVLIYRCWLVYNRSWSVITFSVIIWLSGFGASIGAIFLTSQYRFADKVATAEKYLWPVMVTAMSCGIVLNIVTTGLIVYRIWRVDSQKRDIMSWSHLTNPHDSQMKIPLSGLRKAMFTIIESGVMYTGMSIISFATFITQTKVFFIASHMQVQVAGIAFTLIIVRASAARYRTSDLLLNANNHPGPHPQRRTGSGSIPLSTITFSDSASPASAPQVQLSLRSPLRSQGFAGLEFEGEEGVLVDKLDEHGRGGEREGDGEDSTLSSKSRRTRRGSLL